MQYIYLFLNLKIVKRNTSLEKSNLKKDSPGILGAELLKERRNSFAGSAPAAIKKITMNDK
jgi:hypothetical protein